MTHKAQQASIALTIAGSDSGGGAGIQADIKTFAAHGVYGASVLTVVTAQNTQGVDAVFPLPAALVTQQMDAVGTDFSIAAAKTGALGNAGIVRAVAEFFLGGPIALVVDPVMLSKHGYALIDQEAVAAMQGKLAPLARVVTPNLQEAAALTGLPLACDRTGMQSSAEALGRLGWRACVIKGGHLSDDPVDLLWEDGRMDWLPGRRIDTEHLHGTGCTFSAAITANLVRGMTLAGAVSAAKEYITGAIVHGQRFGRGINPVNHFWRTDPVFGNFPQEG